MEDKLDPKIVLELGKAIGQLNETSESVRALSQDLKQYIASHELSRADCINGNKQSFEKLGKKIDDHVTIDHVENIKYMNWFMSIRKHATYIIVALLGILFMVVAPDSVRDTVYRTFNFIRQII